MLFHLKRKGDKRGEGRCTSIREVKGVSPQRQLRGQRKESSSEPDCGRDEKSRLQSGGSSTRGAITTAPKPEGREKEERAKGPLGVVFLPYLYEREGKHSSSLVQPLTARSAQIRSVKKGFGPGPLW